MFWFKSENDKRIPSIFLSVHIGLLEVYRLGKIRFLFSFNLFAYGSFGWSFLNDRHDAIFI